MFFCGRFFFQTHTKFAVVNSHVQEFNGWQKFKFEHPYDHPSCGNWQLSFSENPRISLLFEPTTIRGADAFCALAFVSLFGLPRRNIGCAKMSLVGFFDAAAE